MTAVKKTELFKIQQFPEMMFRMNRMVGFRNKPIVLINIKMRSDSSAAIQVKFRTVVQRVSRFDTAKLVDHKIEVLLKTVTGTSYQEVIRRSSDIRSEWYRELDFQMRTEIDSYLNSIMDIVVLRMKQGRLLEYIGDSGREGIKSVYY